MEVKRGGSLNKKKKIIIDLDVITVAEWDKSQQGITARTFIERVKNKEFNVFTPYIIFDLINDWKHISLVKKIKEFYELHSRNIISVLNLEERITELNFEKKKLISDLKFHVIKEEDIILVIMSSIFDIDCLVTFNRKHLRNKEGEINETLHKYKLKKICIVLPNEI